MIKPNDVIMLRLDSQDHNPVGYIWYVKPENFTRELDNIEELAIYPTSGLATTLSNYETCKEIDNRAVDISKGDYLGYQILSYEVLKRIE